MPFKNNPGCSCCEDVDLGCCQTIDIKPMPTRTVNGSVVTYSDTAWDATYVSGISGTDNTVPANTTVTISVPVGCTDYVVDVEVLDDAGQHVTNSSPGLTIKVGDCLQASNVNRATNSVELDYGTSTDTIQNPTIFSQHDVDTVERDSADLSGNPIRPFYGDYYSAYRFFEIFHAAHMRSGINSYRNPKWRSDVTPQINGQVESLRLPPDAGGLTIQVTIETGSQAVEIGKVTIYSGHHNCTVITALDDVPLGGPVCPDVRYTVTDPSSYIVNNGASTQTSSKSGSVQPNGFCAVPTCSYTYSTSFNFSQWTGNHNWDLYFYDLGAYNIPPGVTFYDDGSAATTSQQNALLAYLGKCVSHQWSHSDRLVDWRLFEWVEPELNASTYSISHSLSITGTCNIVAESQANITAYLDTIRDKRILPSQGPLFVEQPGYIPYSACHEPTFCTGDPQTVYSGISYNPFPSYTAPPRSCKPVMLETSGLSEPNVKDFWNLSSSFTYPAAKATATPSRTFSFVRSAVTNATNPICSFTYSHNLVDVDVSDEATITKIPFYIESDFNATLLGGNHFYIASTRDNHLKNLELYIASESSTFTATNGIVMQYTAINLSTNRPDYATCNCPCTASELFNDDIIKLNKGTSPPVLCARYHRWMEFTDGTDTWYVKWFTTYPHDISDWQFLFRRASDCKEISFTGVSNALPSSTGSVTKTGSNSNSDTMSIDVLT